jgi:hypothetical protein
MVMHDPLTLRDIVPDDALTCSRVFVRFFYADSTTSPCALCRRFGARCNPIPVRIVDHVADDARPRSVAGDRRYRQPHAERIPNAKAWVVPRTAVSKVRNRVDGVVDWGWYLF